MQACLAKVAEKMCGLFIKVNTNSAHENFNITNYALMMYIETMFNKNIIFGECNLFCFCCQLFYFKSKYIFSIYIAICDLVHNVDSVSCLCSLFTEVMQTAVFLASFIFPARYLEAFSS